MDRLWLLLTIAMLEFSGTSADTIDGRIISGVDARARQFSFFAQLSVILTANGESHERVWCGGSIISRRHVLTCAHCMPSTAWYLENATFHVYVGKTKIRKNGMLTGEQRILVKQIFNHEKFNGSDGLNNDIAIMELQRPMEFTDTVQKIGLSDDDFDKESYRNEDCHMVGYGYTGYMRDPDFSVIGFAPQTNTLQTTRVNLETNRVCNYFWEHSSLHTDPFKKMQICTATLEGHAPCRGDSGAPVVCRDHNGAFRQVGVVSYGLGLYCTVGVTGNTRVSYFRSWIANILA